GAAVYRVAGGQVRRIALPDAGPVTYHGCVDQLTVGAGYLWALSNPVHDQGSLLRAVDLTSRAPAGPVTSLHAQAFGIAFADRVLWVLVRPKGGDTNTRVLSIVDPSTRTFVGRPIPVGTFADRIASGEGALW